MAFLFPLVSSGNHPFSLLVFFMFSGKVNLANDKLLRFKWGKYVVLCSCCELLKATGTFFAYGLTSVFQAQRMLLLSHCHSALSLFPTVTVLQAVFTLSQCFKLFSHCHSVSSCSNTVKVLQAGLPLPQCVKLLSHCHIASGYSHTVVVLQAALSVTLILLQAALTLVSQCFKLLSQSHSY